MSITRNWVRILALAVAALASAAASAEADKLRIALQPSITNLPLMLIQDGKLVEKHAKEAGLGNVEVTWLKFSGGNIMNESLLSGNLDLASTGAPSFLFLWDKAQRSLDVKGIASYGATPLFLVTRNPDVKSIRDLSNKDRIAVPAVKSSVQAIILQMAAEKEWGKGQHGRLDGFTISRGHSDAAIAMLSPNNEINGHFAAPPYAQQELAQPGYRTILKSYDVFGGPLSNGIIYTTSRFYEANPKLTAAFLKSLDEALDFIRTQPRASAERYLRLSGDKLTVDQVEKIIADPLANWSSTPQNQFKFAEYMYGIGSLKRKADSWKDLFFPIVHSKAGS
ncbi:MAG: ABC transporter substrate-binding protein [Lautropia sp.]